MRGDAGAKPNDDRSWERITFSSISLQVGTASARRFFFLCGFFSLSLLFFLISDVSVPRSLGGESSVRGGEAGSFGRKGIRKFQCPEPNSHVYAVFFFICSSFQSYKLRLPEATEPFPTIIKE